MSVKVGQVWKILHPHNSAPKALATFTTDENYRRYKLMKDVN